MAADVQTDQRPHDGAHRRRLAGLLTASLVVVLAGCSGSDEVVTADVAATSTPTEAPYDAADTSLPDPAAAGPMPGGVPLPGGMPVPPGYPIPGAGQVPPGAGQVPPGFRIPGGPQVPPGIQMPAGRMPQAFPVPPGYPVPQGYPVPPGLPGSR